MERTGTTYSAYDSSMYLKIVSKTSNYHPTNLWDLKEKLVGFFGNCEWYEDRLEFILFSTVSALPTMVRNVVVILRDIIEELIVDEAVTGYVQELE